MISVYVKLKAFTSHPLTRGGMIFFLGSMVTNVGAYLYHVVVGRLLGPEAYGELASLYSLTYLLNVPALVVQTVIAKYIATFAVKNEHGKSRALFVNTTKAIGFISFGLFVLSIPLFGLISDFLHIKNPMYVAYMVISSAVFFVAMVPTSTLQGYQRFTDIAIFGNIGIGLRLIGGAAGAMLGVGMTALLNAVTTFLSYGLSFIPLRFLWKSKSVDTGLSKTDVGRFAIPTMVTILGITSLYSTDVILVKHYFSALDAGLYAGVAMLGKVIFFASSSVAYVLFPAVTQRSHIGEKTDSLIKSALSIVCLLSLGITLGYFLFPEIALSLLFGSSYLGASQYLGWFGIFITLFSLNNVLSTLLIGLGKMRVWIFTLGAALVQVMAISLYHQTIGSVIAVNSFINGILFIVLLIYYRYGKE